ncbi:hypothetical protein Glove_75g68 [Diversispora epigaea]|uniref:Uncharacterized protein n=1 Tax=Diversispora epigaea TaxID=1348612 RepID=A0A397JII9_9GLOM|nr:hypothetical protein Glove_75g68 [Diversispora epigaea]
MKVFGTNNLRKYYVYVGDSGELQYMTNFDATIIHNKILEKLTHGCFGNPFHVVILEAGGMPSSNEDIYESIHVPKINFGFLSIYESADMYKKDFSLNSDDYLDIVGDESIFRRLMNIRKEWPNLRPILGMWHTNKDMLSAIIAIFSSYGIFDLGTAIDIVGDESIFRRLMNIRKEWPNLRPILGMWHTNKDMLSAIIAIFSSYGIFDLGTAIGVKFLDKFEKVIDYRATIRTIELIWVSTGIRIGNFEIQKYTLAAFAPLLPSAGKSNYAQSVAHFFGILEKYPKLEEKLQYVSSFKVSEEKRGHFLAFDEALETFGVKFVKQNITGNVIDSENLKRQYLNNIPISNYDRSVNTRKDIMWDLVNKLLKAFDARDYNEFNNNNDLFHITNPKEMCAEGIKRLTELYGQGLYRIKLIYRQEVLKKEAIITVGRRAKDVTVTKYKDIRTEKKNKKKRTGENLEGVNINEQILPADPAIASMTTENPSIKRARRIPSKEAIQILAPMVVHSSPPTKEEIQQYLIALEKNVPASDVWSNTTL